MIIPLRTAYGAVLTMRFCPTGDSTSVRNSIDDRDSGDDKLQNVQTGNNSEIRTQALIRRPYLSKSASKSMKKLEAL